MSEKDPLSSVNALREEFDDESSTAVAPILSRRDQWRMRWEDFKRLRPLLVRALIGVMALLLTAQLTFNWAIGQGDEPIGPVSIELATEQLGSDLHPTPAPPPIQ